MSLQENLICCWGGLRQVDPNLKIYKLMFPFKQRNFPLEFLNLVVLLHLTCRQFPGVLLHKDQILFQSHSYFPLFFSSFSSEFLSCFSSSSFSFIGLFCTFPPAGQFSLMLAVFNWTIMLLEDWRISTHFHPFLYLYPLPHNSEFLSLKVDCLPLPLGFGISHWLALANGSRQFWAYALCLFGPLAPLPLP